MAAVTSLKRSGKNNYVGMLAAIGMPTTWQEETLLLRFVEENGVSTAFTITKGALQSFKAVELWRIYDIEVPGSCVKICKNQDRTGVLNTFEVRVAFHMKCNISNEAWPLRAVYNFVDWEHLNQKQVNTYVDLVGRVLSSPTLDQNSSLPKKLVQLGFKNMHQTVALLGKHSSQSLKTDDILVLGGVKIKEWQHERTLESSFLTLLEVNPASRNGLHIIHDIGTEEPKRKVLRVTLPDAARVSDVKAWAENLLQKAPTEDCKEFTLTGKFAPLTAKFFEEDPPIVGDDTKAKMCWRTTFQDESGCCDVKVWDKPCYNLFGLTASGLRAKWEEGLEDPAKRNDILLELNGPMENSIRCLCKLSVWSYGAANAAQHLSQINVNLIDEIVE